MKVSWDVDIPNIWENKSHVPNHQPDKMMWHIQKTIHHVSIFCSSSHFYGYFECLYVKVGQQEHLGLGSALLPWSLVDKWLSEVASQPQPAQPGHTERSHQQPAWASSSTQKKTEFSIGTLWLCQNNYWTWPLTVSFPIDYGDFP